MDDAPDEKRTRLRYAGTCRICGAALDAGTEAVYERSLRSVRCLTCSPTPAPVESGTAGASARREHERRRAKREGRIRAKHPKLGGLILALSDDPQSTTAWKSGALGEERLGQRLDGLASDTLLVLHDRRVPGTRANIDHIAVTPTGVYAIDAKRYVGQRPSMRVEGGLLRPRVEKLMVGSRDRSKLVDSVLTQVDLVRSIVGPEVPVTGILCFVEADWPLIGGAFTIRGVEVVWPKKLSTLLAAEGPHTSAVVHVHRSLATALSQA
ncbi:nuclease-related domain-containing protein [Pimelobacter simplex]|uniref:nuclease-related domain-containing protein n=1 Tax=Nocardioides simplex TaxID=2045 RepID=UPI00193226B7|nr:NERD domain-containing protein [Pimelobacter simplex]